jgi:hypothetical protein
MGLMFYLSLFVHLTRGSAGIHDCSMEQRFGIEKGAAFPGVLYISDGELWEM